MGWVYAPIYGVLDPGTKTHLQVYVWNNYILRIKNQCLLCLVYQVSSSLRVFLPETSIAPGIGRWGFLLGPGWLCQVLFLAFRECFYVSINNWMGPNPNGPLSKLRSSYMILRFFRGPFSGSCWRFLGMFELVLKTIEALRNSSSNCDLSKKFWVRHN